MRLRGLKSAAVGGIAGALCATATVALAGSGVGAVFNLGQTNSVNGASSLVGTTGGSQLNVVNASTAAAARALVAYAKSPSAAAAVVQNAGGGPALGLAVNAGQPPLRVNSSTKVVGLNADQVDGLDASAFQPRYARTVVARPVGTAVQNGTALKSALAGITMATATDPWLLKIEAGTYDVGSSPLVLKANVDVEGSGEGVTKIQGAGGCGSTESITVSAVVAVEMRDLSVKNTGGCAIATAIRSDSLPLRLRSVTATASGGTSETRGIVLAGEVNPELLDVTAVGDSGDAAPAAYGVKIVNAVNVGIANLHATGAGDTVDAAALRVEGSTVYVRNSWLRTPFTSFSDQKAFEAVTSSYLVVIGSFLDSGAPTHDGGSTAYCGGDYSRTAVLVTC